MIENCDTSGGPRPPAPIPPFTLRRAMPDDAAALSALLTESYRVLLAPDYAPTVLAAALPIIGRAQAELLSSPGYVVAEAGGGDLIAAGGWTWRGPAGGAAPVDWGHIRHVAVHPAHAGCGIGGVLLSHVVDDAAEAGVRMLSCLSTLTARGYYRHMGFVDQGEVDLALGPGLRFPAVQMRRVL